MNYDYEFGYEMKADGVLLKAKDTDKSVDKNKTLMEELLDNYFQNTVDLSELVLRIENICDKLKMENKQSENGETKKEFKEPADLIEKFDNIIAKEYRLLNELETWVNKLERIL